MAHARCSSTKLFLDYQQESSKRSVQFCEAMEGVLPEQELETTCRPPQHKIRVVNTFVEGLEEPSDDDADTMVKTRTEPARRTVQFSEAVQEEGVAANPAPSHAEACHVVRQLPEDNSREEQKFEKPDTMMKSCSGVAKRVVRFSEVSRQIDPEPEPDQEETPDEASRLPQHKIRVVNTFIDQPEDSEDEPIVKTHTEPSHRRWESPSNDAKPDKVAGFINDLDGDDEKPRITRMKTFDPFEHSGVEYANEDSDLDELPITKVKTYDPFDHSGTEMHTACQESARRGVVLPQPVVMLGVPMMVLAPVSGQTDPTTAAPMACMGQQGVPIPQQALPCLLGQKSPSPPLPEKPRDAISLQIR